jgi:hypothetical protein
MRASRFLAVLLRTSAERADDQARLAGLTVEVLDRGRRRYHDPRLDGLASRQQPVGRPLEVEQWSAPTLTATSTAGWPL